MQQQSTLPEPGFYRDVDFDDYARWDALNASTLKGFKRTPAHVNWLINNPRATRTPALDLGWLTHLSVLEPERFAASVAVAPRADGRTRTGKSIIAEFAAEHPDSHIVTENTFRQVKQMSAAVFRHETAKSFFAGRGLNELSILWEDADHGIKCKARLDRLGEINGWPIIGDLKTAKSAARRDFERSTFDYGYDVQAAHYLSGVESLVPTPAGSPFRRFVFFVVESIPPYEVACYEPYDETIEEAAMKRSRYIRKWKECTRTGVWHGYPAGIEYAGIPGWAQKNYVDE